VRNFGLPLVTYHKIEIEAVIMAKNEFRGQIMKQKKRNIINFQTDEDLDAKIDKIKKSTGIRATSDLLRYLITSAAEKVVDIRNESN
jgi:hypothetical protein